MGTCGDVGLVGLVSPCPVLARAGGQLLRINHRDPDSCGVVDLGGAGVCGSGRVALIPVTLGFTGEAHFAHCDAVPSGVSGLEAWR